MQHMILFACIALLMTGCRIKPHHTVTPAVYYWKTVFAPTAYERMRLIDAGCNRMYVRCFDVSRDPATGAPKPVGVIRNLAGADASFRYIPVVFITQDVLRGLSAAETNTLAGQIASLVQSIFSPLPVPDEIQIDCDWTTTTRDAYFSLLTALRRQPFMAGKSLSCTIRLHQIKYRLRSGIPPADRGLLMCYNMGSLKQPGSHNSIIDVPLAKSYLGDLDSYPLQMDVALPLFSWCLQFREGHLKGILRDVPPDAIINSPLFTNEGGPLFSCTADTVWHDYPFQKGDVVRVETSRQADVLELARYTAKSVRNDSLRVILFHSDSLTLAKHPTDDLEAIYGAFR